MATGAELGDNSGTNAPQMTGVVFGIGRSGARASCPGITGSSAVRSECIAPARMPQWVAA